MWIWDYAAQGVKLGATGGWRWHGEVVGAAAGLREGSRGWHLSPPAAASLVQGSSRSCFSSVSTWQIPPYCRVPGYIWAALCVLLPARDTL